MFTGIIEEIGTVEAVRKGKDSSVLTLGASVVMSDLKLGDSVAVDGVCLTASSLNSSSFSADVMHETLSRSTLGKLTRGSKVNLERALLAQGRFGGHIVSGHIDGTGTITAIRQDDNAVWYTVKADAAILRYIVEKGSIAIDGISLTVARITDEDFSVSLIPHTLKETTLAVKKVGSLVNLENDLLAKYVEKLLGAPGSAGTEQPEQSTLTREFLLSHGF
ncbi:MAG: riboflavin synthase [Coriobacteriia bacterium]|nr:riboflavin synthase [Coriobacteriia bacterium]